MLRRVMLVAMLAAVAVFVGCRAVDGTVHAVATPGLTATQTVESARRLDFYQSQAGLLGRLLEGESWQKAWESTETGPVPKNGAFTARIMGVNEASGTVTFNRIQFFTKDAARAARADGRAKPPSGYYVRDRYRERRELPLADDAIGVVYFMDTDWVKGDLFVETQAGSPVVAMDRATFAKRYRDDGYLRSALRDTGAVFVARNGKVVYIKANYRP